MSTEPEKNRRAPELQKTPPPDRLAPRLQVRRDQVVWTIAGFDPGSGAGITADLMTFAAHGLFGCSAATALTVQTTLGVYGWEPVRTELLQTTLERLAEDLPPLGCKIGMLGTAELATVVGESLAAMAAAHQDRKPVVVFDPVLRSSSGRELFPDAGLSVLRQRVLPWVDWITPNWAELAVLAAVPVRNQSEAVEACRRLGEQHPELHIVATGGDQREPVDLLWVPGGVFEEIRGVRVETHSTHGTGCAFSSALLSQLALGAEPIEATRLAKRYVEGALRHAPGLGGGCGPMELLWPLLFPDQESDRSGLIV